MKKICLLLVLAITNFLPFGTASAQDSTALNQVQLVVPRNLLTPEQLTQLNKMQQAQMVTQDLENYRKWAGMGKEIGVAINDGLKAVSDQTANFAETKPGKLTMLLITWKVLGNDIVGFTQAVTGMVVGIPMLIGFVWVWLFLYRRTTTKRRLITAEEGKKKTYSYEDTWFTRSKDDSGERIAFLVAWWVSFCIGAIWITSGVIF